jgi:hypothetical protein
MHNPRYDAGGGEVYLPIDGPGPVNRQRRYWWGSSVRPTVLSCWAAGRWGLSFPAPRTGRKHVHFARDVTADTNSRF